MGAERDMMRRLEGDVWEAAGHLRTVENLSLMHVGSDLGFLFICCLCVFSFVKGG
jgi:hypothetical protein